MNRHTWNRHSSPDGGQSQFGCPVRFGSTCQSSASPCPLSTGTSGASTWPSSRQMPGPSPTPSDVDQIAATTRHVIRPLASSTHEAPSLRESGEQDQHQENDPHVHTATADAHGLGQVTNLI